MTTLVLPALLAVGAVNWLVVAELLDRRWRRRPVLKRVYDEARQQWYLRWTEAR
jgi:hypothetical protein